MCQEFTFSSHRNRLEIEEGDKRSTEACSRASEGPKMIITVKTLQQKTFKIEIDDAENVRPFSSVVVGRALEETRVSVCVLVPWFISVVWTCSGARHRPFKCIQKAADSHGRPCRG